MKKMPMKNANAKAKMPMKKDDMSEKIQAKRDSMKKPMDYDKKKSEVKERISNKY